MTFTHTKCLGILKMKLIIIVMIKDVRHFQKYDCDVINCSLVLFESEYNCVLTDTRHLITALSPGGTVNILHALYLTERSWFDLEIRSFKFLP